MRTIIQFHDNQTGTWVARITVESGFIHVPRLGDHLMLNDVRYAVQEICTQYTQDEVLHDVYGACRTARWVRGSHER